MAVSLNLDFLNQLMYDLNAYKRRCHASRSNRPEQPDVTAHPARAKEAADAGSLPARHRFD
jgi:hypothetical protein